MKKFLMFVAVICCANLLVVNAQKKEIKINSLSLSSGEGPLSSGLLFEANFTRGDDLLNLYLGERDLCVYYLKPFFNKKVYIGPSWEYYHNIPTLGIMLITNPLAFNDFSISTFSWAGVSAGTPGEKAELLNWQFLFFYQAVSLNYKNFSLSKAVMWYEEWGNLLDLKYTQQINQNFTMFGSGGYSWYGDGKYLFKLGLSYQFK